MKADQRDVTEAAALMSLLLFDEIATADVWYEISQYSMTSIEFTVS